MAADITRASRIAERKNSVTTIGDEPLLVDLLSPVQGFHWVVYQASFIGQFSTRFPAALPVPTVGLYLVPLGAQSESTADGAAGWNVNARGILVPADYSIVQLGATAVRAFACVARPTRELIVPAGWVLRFLANVAPGTATPGPGAGSVGVLAAHVIEESNAAPEAPRRV